MAALDGGVLNAGLGPILIFGVGLRLDGAALVSVAARLMVLITAFLPALWVHAAFARPEPWAIAQGPRAAPALAIPAVLTKIATPIGTAILTRETARHGTEAVAAMAVIGRQTPLVLAGVFALSGAIGPIIGQDHGAGRPDRVRGALDAAVNFTAACVLAAAAILFLLRGPIADLFAAQGNARALIHMICGPLALAEFFDGVIFVANASFNNLGHPGWTTPVNWGRHTLGTWPFVVAGGALRGVIFAAPEWGLAVRLMRGLGAHPLIPSPGTAAGTSCSPATDEARMTRDPQSTYPCPTYPRTPAPQSPPSALACSAPRPRSPEPPSAGRCNSARAPSIPRRSMATRPQWPATAGCPARRSSSRP